MKARHLEERIARLLMGLAAWTILAVFLLLLGTVLAKGLPAMTLDMVTRTPQGGFYLGREGGVLNAIVGSLLVAGATLLALLAALPVALYLNVYRRRGSRFTSLVRLALDALWGIPSIVYGAFGFAVMLFFRLGASLLGGILTVGLLVLPILCRAMDEVVRTVPRELGEASLALGATRTQTAFRVVARQALPGLVGALLLAFGRGIGDAASVLFTAGFSDHLPTSLMDPVATLPLAIFFQLGSPVPEVQDRAYASALILTGIILGAALGARALARRWRRHVIR